MSSTKTDEKDTNFSKFYKNRLEKRIVDYLETAVKLYPPETLEKNIQAQVALISKSIENIALMMAEQGYVNNFGYFVRFTPQDLLTIQNALSAALKLRADVMMQPMGLEALTKSMASLDKVHNVGVGTTNPHTGLAEPPEMVAVDSQPDVVEEPMGPVEENIVPNYALAVKK